MGKSSASGPHPAVRKSLVFRIAGQAVIPQVGNSQRLPAPSSATVNRAPLGRLVAFQTNYGCRSGENRIATSAKAAIDHAALLRIRSHAAGYGAGAGTGGATDRRSGPGMIGGPGDRPEDGAE